MVAIPFPLVVERYDKYVGPLQGSQNVWKIQAVGWQAFSLYRYTFLSFLIQRFTQRRRDALEDRGLEQEILNGRGLAFQHFFHQVVQDVTVAAGKILDILRQVGPSLQGQLRQQPLVQQVEQVRARNQPR